MKAFRKIVGLSLSLLPALAWSADYYVAPDGTGDYSSPTTPGGSVSHAIHNLAAEGDTIHLAVGDYDLTGQHPSAGTYAHLQPTVKNLTIVGGSSDPTATRLLGDGTGRVFYFEKKNANDASGLAIRDLTVRGGKTVYQGGGICGNKLPFTVSNVVVEACSSAYQGGGGYCGTWIDCTFGGCSMSGKNTSGSLGYGGAAFGGTYRHCLFTNNTATTGYGGALGGSSADAYWMTVADDCTFSNNVAQIAGGALFGCSATNSTIACNEAKLNSNSPTFCGGGASESTLVDCRIFCNTNSASLGGGTGGGTNIACTIAGNYAKYAGGMFSGVSIGCTVCSNGCSTAEGTAGYKATTYNCRVFGHGGNKVLANGYHQGDLIYSNVTTSSGCAIAASGATATAVNCTVADNSRVGIATATITNCLCYGNGYADVSELVCAVNSAWGKKNKETTGSETGCIPLDARPFVAEVGPNQDAYSLDPNSACVDKAFALDWMAGAVDILGNKRVFNKLPDIGACEAFWRRGFLLMFR